MDFTNTKLAELNEDKRSLPRPKKRQVFNKGGHKHGERRRKGLSDKYEFYDAEFDKWLPEKKFDKNKKVDQHPRNYQTFTQRMKAIDAGENTELTEDRVDRMLGSHNFDITKFTDKDLERFVRRHEHNSYEEWKVAAKKRVGEAHRSRMKPRGYTRRVEDYDLDELIDGIMDETKRIPRSISGRRKWRSKVADDAKESGRDTETVNKEHRKSLSDSLRNSKKAKGTRYEDGKWHTNNNRTIGRAQGHVESFQPLSASDALLILQEKKTYYSRCKCRGKCDCEAKMKARREAKKNQIKESALVLYGKYYNTNITEPTIAEQFKKRIDYCIANERDFDFLQSNIYVELFESLINERQQDYDAFISDVEPQEDDLYKEAFTDEHVNNIVDEMFASETIDNLMDKRAEEEIAYINDNYKQKLKMMGLL